MLANFRNSLYLCLGIIKNEIMETKAKDNKALMAILKKSHEQALAGQTFSMDYVEHFMSDKLYELTHRMDTCSVAESV